jgi:hypothetical protein
MKPKIFIAILTGLSFVILITPTSSAATKIVIRAPKSTTVSLGNSIQTAINSAAEGDTIVLAAGTYNETVTIAKDGLTIQGAGSGSTILDGGGSALPVISINGAKNVSIKGLTIQNGYDGVNASNGASLTVENSILKNNNDDGLDIQNNCIAKFIGTLTAKNNMGRGVSVANSSSLCLDKGNTMTLLSNQYDGIQVTQTSSAEIRGTLLADANVHTGIRLSLSSSLFSDGSITVQGTTGAGIGIFIHQASAFHASGGDLTVQNNIGTYGDGIMVARDSSLDLRGSSPNVLITNNEKNGIAAYQASSVRLDSGVKVNQNSGNGIGIFQQSTLFASSIEVKNNLGVGIGGDEGSSIDCQNSTITGNNPAISLSFGSISTLNGNSISPTPISCDATVLSRGSHVCP